MVIWLAFSVATFLFKAPKWLLNKIKGGKYEIFINVCCFDYNFSFYHSMRNRERQYFTYSISSYKYR
ncbi:hypothetical protein BSK56_24195 [Paenibacillus borealis]|uniref:Uncharacterized protein n=1 Tax=Paenibacillus borealis TaxID=160799 RepID=A0ABX3H150_PAEBO|nr:hypothetical protein BSK56_24195 [Paenibacillus borealis]